MEALYTLVGLLVALLVLRAAPPVLWLRYRHTVEWSRAVVLVWITWRVRQGWQRFCRETKLAILRREGRVTTRSALWAVMPGVRVERKAEDRYAYPTLRVRCGPYGPVATVTTTPTASRAKLADLAPRIADSWGCHRVEVEQPKPGKVRLRGIRYEPLADCVGSPLMANGQPTVRPGQLSSTSSIHLAMDQHGQPIEVTLATSAHGLLAGVTRSGKSITVNTLLASASLMRDVRMVIIDPNLAAAAPWWRTAHRVSSDQHPSEATELLAEVRAEMETRQGLFWNGRTDQLTDFDEDLPLYLVVIDEVTNYTRHADKKAAEAFQAELLGLASQGAKFGVRLWLIAQKPSADVVPTAVRTNLTSRVCHRVDTTEDFVHLFPDGRQLGISAADREMPKGVSIAHVSGMRAPVRAKSVYLPTEACWTISDALVDAGYQVRDLPGPVLTEAAA